MSADWLRELRAAATAGPWDYNLPAGLRVINRNDARLIALAPDLAELLADFVDDLEAQIDAAPPSVRPHMQGAAELLARISALQASAGRGEGSA